MRFLHRNHGDEPCRHMEGLLHRAADGSSRGLARWYAFAHSSKCPGCGKFLKGLQGMLGVLRKGKQEPDRDVVKRLTEVVRESSS